MSGTNLDHIIGRTLGGRYRVMSVIGSGASSEVYRAKDVRLGRDVALKQLRSGMSDDDRFIRLFRSEAQLAAGLAHPNVLTVFDWSDDADRVDGGAYIVTELLTGGTLRHVLQAGGTLSLSQTAFVGLQAAQGLAHAHGQGLVHRDVKPANLFFAADGRVAIGDFGIARAVAEAAWTEPEGVLIGTARYAAPEQAAAERIDASVDVYSLVLCLVEAHTGELPLVRENALGTMVLRQKENIPIDGSFGPLAETLQWGGLSDPAVRATSADLLDGLLEACRALPDPEPFTLIDLTVQTGPDPLTGQEGGDGDGEEPNVRINTEGELVIAGEHSDLTFGPEQRSAGAKDGLDEADAVTDELHEADDEDYGLELEPDFDDQVLDADTDVRPADEPPARGGARVSPLNERTADGYLMAESEEGGRRWGRIVLVMLFTVLALAAMALGLFLGQPEPDLVSIEVGFPKTDVVDLSALTIEEIESGAADANWDVTVTERYQDGTVPGEILSQTPSAGTALPPGAEIFIEISLGPEIRTVPELVGLPVDEARTAIEGSRLAVGEVAERNDEQVNAGVVMESSVDGDGVEPGAEFLTDTPVDLVISAGPSPRSVPPLEGLTVGQATAALEDENLLIATTESHSQTVAEGRIISSRPGAGAQVDRGSTISVTVSLGLPFVEVPGVVGLPVPDAIDVLKADGFEVEINGTVGSEVLATRPVGGESVRQGTTIEIISDN